MEQFKLKYLCVTFVILLLTTGLETRRTSSGGRRTSSSSSRGWGWSRPKSNPKPQTNYGHTSHTSVDNKRLSYDHDTASAPKPSAPNPSNTGWNVGSSNDPSKSNIGWNFGGRIEPKPGQTSTFNVGNMSPNQPRPGQNIGWNVPGSNHPQPGQGPPPPYPGLGTQHHSPVGAQPPPYSSSGTHHSVGAPPPYPGQTGQRFGQNYPNQHQYQPNQNYPHQNYPGYNPYGQQSHGFGQQSHGYGQQSHGFNQPSRGYGGWGTPGFGTPGFGGGYGGYGGHGGFGGGGFGGGGFGGGFNPYSAGFGYKQKSSGFGGIGSHIGTFLAGAMLWNLASNIGRSSNYHVYNNAPPERYYTRDGVPVSSGTSGQAYNVTHNFDKPNEAKMSVDFGNMTCITIYNANRFARWANRTIQQIEYQTKQAFPFGQINMNGTQTGNIQFNFTIEPGKIIHNETVSITCCGTEDVALEFEDIINGKSPTANCVHHIASIPFRAVKVVPLNVTVNITSKDIAALANATAVNFTDSANSTDTASNSTTTAANSTDTASNSTTTVANMAQNDSVKTVANNVTIVESSSSGNVTSEPVTMQPNASTNETTTHLDVTTGS